LVSQIYTKTDSYNPVCYLFAGLITVALIISVLLKIDVREVQKKQVLLAEKA